MLLFRYLPSMVFRMRRLRGSRAGAGVKHQTASTPQAPPPVVASPVPAPRGPTDGVDVPWALRVSAAWAWRLLLLAAATALLLWLFLQLAVVLVPVVLGLLIASLAVPAVDRISARGVPRGLATAVVVVTGIIVLTTMVGVIVQQITSGFDDIQKSFTEGMEQLRSWLTDFGISAAQLADFFDQLQRAVTSGSESLGASVLRATATAGNVVAGVFITLFVVIFVSYDGRRIWSWTVGLLPVEARQPADGSGRRAWAVITSYVQAIVIIAAVDAIGIALVALLLQLPLILPIAVLVFLASFVPVVGAAVSGAAVVAVALVTHGPVSALLMLAGVIAVQQLEAQILQPFLMGRMVRVHPLAVVLVIAIGGVTAGIFGALIAVPLAAVINTVGSYLAGQGRERAAARSAAGQALPVPQP